MYINTLALHNIRTFVNAKSRDLWFTYRGRDFKKLGTKQDRSFPEPRFPNVNLLLGENGSGKTTILQTIALATLGPALPDAQLPLRPYVRLPNRGQKTHGGDAASVKAELHPHQADEGYEPQMSTTLRFEKHGELERVKFDEGGGWSPIGWELVSKSDNSAFFCAAYGATRRIEAGVSLEPRAPVKTRFIRGQRIQSILDDSFSLRSLINWLPVKQKQNPARFQEIKQLLNAVLKPSGVTFTGRMTADDYLFCRGGTEIPSKSLSDGYRAFIAWFGDLLFHLDYASPPHDKLTKLCGVVLVDEIDLHLHPRWQMKVVATLARALPNIQYFFTSHSALVAGSLEWMNIIALKASVATNRTTARRWRESIHGLDADQILLTDFFGLPTTRAQAKRRELDKLKDQARSGDREAARRLILAMANGTEKGEP